jgi:hypothetical protein
VKSNLSGRRKATLGGLVFGRQIVSCDSFTSHHRMYIDYFCDSPTTIDLTSALL